MKLNTKPAPIYTHGGAIAAHINPEQQLRRSVLSCLLWEGEHYEDGKTIADRIEELAKSAKPEVVHALAVEARTQYNLRHVPLLLLSVKPNAEAIYNTISRADELTELLAIFWRKGRRTIPSQMKKGLAKAFTKFDEYSLSKYNRDGKIKLRDVLFMVHAKPKDDAQKALWKRLVDKQLTASDTWEVALSSGADKKETFERLLKEEKLGYMALLRNLRNMTEAKVDSKLVTDAILARKGGADKVLPFRFIAAARAVPSLEETLDKAMLESLTQFPKLKGKTLVVVDTSGSMRSPLSSKSDMNRMDAACALGAIAREICEESIIFATAGSDGARQHATAEVPLRRGMALVDATQNMQNKIGGGGIFLNQVCNHLRKLGVTCDRMIVITDEQDCSHGDADSPSKAVPLGTKANYMINVASAKNGIGYNQWTHIDGFSENVFRFIQAVESNN